MHRMLIIQELIRIICSFVEERDEKSRPTLVALARVCKALREPALDELWYTQISLFPIIMVLLGDAIQIRDAHLLPYDDDDDNESDDEDTVTPYPTIYLARFLTKEDITYLRTYSRRVHELNVNVNNIPYIIDHSISQALTSKMRYLFPRLQRLTWFNERLKPRLAQLSMFYTLVLAPRLTYIRLTEGLESKLLSPLLNRCSNLEHLLITNDPQDEDPESFQNPWEFDFPFGWPLLCSSLTSLKHLTMCLDSSGITSSRSLWRHMPKWSLQIEDLHLDANSIKRVVDFLTNATFPSLASIHLKFSGPNRGPPMCKDIEDLFTAISGACSHTELREVHIIKEELSGRMMMFNLESYIIRPCAFESLLQFPFLTKLEITGPGRWHWDLDDTFLSQVCRTWSNLRVLIVDPSDHWPINPHITLGFLGMFNDFAPQLEAFGARVDANTVQSSHARRESQSSIRKLLLDHSPLTSVFHVTQFLCTTFPNLQQVCRGPEDAAYRSSALHTRWLEVSELIYPFRFLFVMQQHWPLDSDSPDPLERLAICKDILSRHGLSV